MLYQLNTSTPQGHGSNSTVWADSPKDAIYRHLVSVFGPVIASRHTIIDTGLRFEGWHSMTVTYKDQVKSLKVKQAE